MYDDARHGSPEGAGLLECFYHCTDNVDGARAPIYITRAVWELYGKPTSREQYEQRKHDAEKNATDQNISV